MVGLKPAPERWMMPALLASLYAVLWLQDELDWARPLFLIHLGVFLLWQPVWAGRQRVGSPALGALLALAALGWLAMGGWFLAFWLSGLIGLVGGRVHAARARRARLVHLLALAFLLLALLAWLIPGMLGTQSATAQWLKMALPTLIVAMALTPPERQRSRDAGSLDFFYGINLFLLVNVLILGTLVVHAYGAMAYYPALVLTTVGMAGALGLLGWLWGPRGEFGGLGTLLSRYLLSLSLPFEEWSRALAQLAAQPSTPPEFLRAACEEMKHLPGVTGGHWQTPNDRDRFGEFAAITSEFRHGDLLLTIHSHHPLGPALQLHLRLLVDLLGEFYLAKQREAKLRQHAYLQAVHETGARLTHDVKNLLQSLKTLCAAAEASDTDSAAFRALVGRQLPQISQRLELTLEKLRAPEPSTVETRPANAWWAEFRQRHAAEHIQFTGKPLREVDEVPAEAFDTVADNLLDNARHKRAGDAEIRITVDFSWHFGPVLTVSDTGQPVPPELLNHLFEAPVASHTGLGLGLMQSARLAARSGFVLRLEQNEAGKVSFVLRRDAMAT